MEDTQLVGHIQTKAHGPVRALLSWDRDLPDEAIISMWEFPAIGDVVIVTSRSENDDSSVRLTVTAIYCLSDKGELLPLAKTEDEQQLFLSIHATLHREQQTRLAGSWEDREGRSGHMQFQPLQYQASPPDICETWQDFKSWALKAKDEYQAVSFRGQGSSEFQLQTTFHRAGRTNLYIFLRDTLTLFHTHAEAITSIRLNRNDPLDFSVLLGLAQHHGLPTPLLDWTASPYIAAFFAFADALENRVIRPTAKNIRIFALTKPFIDMYSPPIVPLSRAAPFVNALAISPRNNPRLYAQQGAFLASNISNIEGYIRNLESHHTLIFLRSVDVPISQATIALEDLAFMGLSAATLFPGLDGVCRMLKHSMSFKHTAIKAPGLPSAKGDDGASKPFTADPYEG